MGVAVAVDVFSLLSYIRHNLVADKGYLISYIVLWYYHYIINLKQAFVGVLGATPTSFTLKVVLLNHISLRRELLYISI